MSDRIALCEMAFCQLNRTERRAFLAKHAGPAATPAAGASAAPFRVLRRAEVAERLARTPRAVDRLAAAGVLRRVRLPGRVRGAGFLESEVAALVEARP